MSVRALDWVFRCSPVKHRGDLLVLLVLADHAHDDGRSAYPSVDTIARKARLTRRGAQLALRRLADDGAITRELPDGPRGTRSYRLIMGSEVPSPSLVERGEVDAPGGRSERQEGAKGSSPEPSIEPSGEPPQARKRARSVRFGGKIINNAVVDLAAAVVEIFNGTAGTSYRPFTDDGKPSENLKRVLGAVIGDQRITAEVAERMIQQALGKADPFWGNSTPHLGHVFGPRVVEGNLEQALRAAAGGPGGLSDGDRHVLASQQRTALAEREFQGQFGRVSA